MPQEMANGDGVDDGSAGTAMGEDEGILGFGRRAFVRLAGGAAAAAAGLPSLSGIAGAAPQVDGGALRYVGEIVGTSTYDYAPSVMWGDGVTMKMWWCSHSGSGDAIMYSELSGGSWSSPQVVMTSSSSGWDSVHVCDPSVVKGSFTNENWDYAMYYGGADDSVGTDTEIGVAFSNDGTSWVKHPMNPIISPDNPDGGYGAGMPSAYRRAGTEDDVILAFFDSTTSPNNHYVESGGGVIFGSRTDLTADPIPSAIGDIAYFHDEDVWYICTKNNNDEESYIYKTANSDLNSTWTEAARINNVLTGNSHNHNPCWLRHPNGRLRESTRTQYKRLYFGTGSSSPSSWDIGETMYMDGWEFNDDGNKEGWTSNNVSADGGEPTDGSWKIIADQDDPSFSSPDNALAINPQATSTIRVLMSNHNDDTNGKIYFRTSAEDYLTEDKSVSFTVDNTGDWIAYDVDMSQNDKWTGMVTSFRVDPIRNGSGDSLGIGYIRLDG